MPTEQSQTGVKSYSRCYIFLAFAETLPYTEGMLKQAHIYVKGDVAKVGFRGMMRIKARECGITGYVRNVYDKPEIFGPHGGTEMIIQGEEESLMDMLEYIKDGSEISRVDDIEIRYEDPTEIYEDLEVRKSKSFHPHE